MTSFIPRATGTVIPWVRNPKPFTSAKKLRTKGMIAKLVKEWNRKKYK